MKKSTFKSIALIGLGLSIGLSSCKDDEEEILPGNMHGNGNSNTPAFLQSEIDKLGAVTDITIATTYDLSASAALAPGAYNGQKTRLAQLTELKSYTRDSIFNINFSDGLAKSNGFAFTSADANITSADLRTKIDELNYDNGNTSVADDFAALADSLTNAQSVSMNAAANGTAGYSGRRHFSANGLEYAQILEKGLYGAIFYDQMVDNYLRPTQAGAQNTKGNNSGQAGSDYATNGTGRQHRFDEVFGYFGANPLTYPNAANTSNGDGEFVANYTFDFSDEVETAMDVNVAQKLMDAFLFGRSALKAGEGTTASNESTNETYYNAARADIKLYSEIGLATAAYHYLNDAISDVNNADDLAKLHHLSEGIAFIYALSFNSEGLLSSSEAYNVLVALGWDASDRTLSGIYKMNLWNVTATQMEQAKTLLDKAYPGFGDLPL